MMLRETSMSAIHREQRVPASLPAEKKHGSIGNIRNLESQAAAPERRILGLWAF